MSSPLYQSSQCFTYSTASKEVLGISPLPLSLTFPRLMSFCRPQWWAGGCQPPSLGKQQPRRDLLQTRLRKPIKVRWGAGPGRFLEAAAPCPRAPTAPPPS